MWVGAIDVRESRGDTLDLIERILCLQQVAMFSELQTEDLRRVAENVEERRYARDEVICRFGDPGDEMLVIASGRVRTSKEVDGEVRPCVPTGRRSSGWRSRRRTCGRS